MEVDLLQSSRTQQLGTVDWPPLSSISAASAQPGPRQRCLSSVEMATVGESFGMTESGMLFRRIRLIVPVKAHPRDCSQLFGSHFEISAAGSDAGWMDDQSQSSARQLEQTISEQPASASSESFGAA